MHSPGARFWYGRSDNDRGRTSPSHLVQDPSNTFLRPILFVTDNATRVTVEGITQLNSPCWTNFFVRTDKVSFDNVLIHAYSTNASVIALCLGTDS